VNRSRADESDNVLEKRNETTISFQSGLGRDRMELRTKRPSSSRPFAMEPPVSPAAPTNKTWVFDMLAGR